MSILGTPAGNPVDLGALERNGFARLGDLENAGLEQVLRRMERFQAEFMASTREIWNSSSPFTGDSLYHWSRRWEYPYCWLNLPRDRPGRVLDAGSGITFFPFFLAREGWQVACADTDRALAPIFERAGLTSGTAIEFRANAIESLEWPDRAFDAVVCVSVLEHSPARSRAVEEFARVLGPGGRLVLTWDVSLSRDCDILMEDAAVLLSALERHFEPVHPLDLLRPADLLTTDRARGTEPWRLPWRPHPGRLRRALGALLADRSRRSVAVMGTAWVKRG